MQPPSHSLGSLSAKIVAMEPTSPALGEALLPPREAASILRVEVETLADWRFHRIGPPYVKTGRLVRYRPSDLEQWIRDRTVTPQKG